MNHRRPRRGMILSAAAAVLAAGLAATSVVWAQSAPAPTTQQQQGSDRPQQPTPFRTGSGERRVDGRGDGVRGGGAFRSGNEEWRRGDARPDGPNFVEPTDKEWDDIRAFMEKHSPERLKRMVEDIADDTRRQSVRNTAAARYRALQELKDRDPKLYEIRLKRMKIEDDVFALSWDMKRADKPDRMRAELRGKLREMVRSSLDERRYHLAKAAERLKESQKELQEDELDPRIDAAVDAKMKDMDDDRWPRDLRPPPRRPRDAEGINAAPADAKREQQD